MAISMDELMRAFGRPMNPNVQQVGSAPGTGVNVPMAQPARAPVVAPMPTQAPAAPQQPRGLLGGFFGPEGRDARARLAIALEGMTLNPNQALISELQSGIERRETAAQKNATAEWLRSRGRDDLAAAMEGGLPAADALRIAMEPAAQPEIREVDGRLVSVSPDGTVRELYGSAPTPDPQSAIAKLEADRRAGLINDEQYQAGLQALAPTGMTIESDGAGGFRMVQGAGVGAGGKPATEGQLAGGGYLQRMTAAEARLRDIERKTGSIAIPIEKTIFMDTGLEGYALTPTEQQIAQAQRDWVRSKLRKESGAVIGTEEMAAEIRTYFPQPGESAETARQKAEARRLAERQMEITAGPAAAQAGAISPAYAPPITMGELEGLGIGTGMSTQSQPVVIDGVTIRKVN